MVKSYSMDLRDRVVAFVEAGHSRRAAARHFGISESSAIRYAQLKRDKGSCEPARQGRPPGGGKVGRHLDLLVEQVEAQPDITMPELALVLAEERGVSANPASLSRVLCAAGFTYKKTVDGIGMRTR